MLVEPLLGEYELDDTARGIPESGISVPKLRVELAVSELPDEAWFSELTILDRLPVFGGDTVKVEARIMNDAFREKVARTRPLLTVRYGPHIVGKLRLAQN